MTARGACFFVPFFSFKDYRQSFALEGCHDFFSLFVRNRVVLFCGLVAEWQYNPPSSSSWVYACYRCSLNARVSNKVDAACADVRVDAQQGYCMELSVSERFIVSLPAPQGC